MSKIIIVSNRLPISISKREGKLLFRRSSGGLATGVSSIHKSKETLWIGWPGLISSSQEKANITKELRPRKLVPVFLTQKKIEKYYEGFSNRTIWPLFHYFSEHVYYDESLWRAYENVNHIFAEQVLNFYDKGDMIWVHDYQLMLVPSILRDRYPEASVGFFLHIPFPSFEIFRTLPWRQQILDGLLGADLIGFHTFDYARHFLSSILRLKGLEQEMQTVYYNNRYIRIDSFPMGIDYKKYAAASQSHAVQKYLDRFIDPKRNRKIIVSIDRLDYSKGLVQRLEAFQLFLENNPEYHGKVEFILLVVPSRVKVEYYRQLKKKIDEYVGRINGIFGNMEWTPVHYFYRSLPYYALISLFYYADIGLVTPLRDGMNLVAKEFIACHQDKPGVLILSEMAGAANELGAAILINPNDMNDIVSAIKKAITMDIAEQKERLKHMQNQISRYDVEKWAGDFMTQLEEVIRIRDESGINVLTPEIMTEIENKVTLAKNALCILDYDGTLVPFTNQPEQAKPSRELVALLRTLNNCKSVHVVIVSGRDRESLDAFFADLDVDIVAEHGAWIGNSEGAGRQWHTIAPLSDEWKEEIRHILDRYVIRTPGSFIEEKEFSLVWHYRQSDVGLGQQRAHELRETLSYITANLNLQVLEGAKIVEVKNSGINKGRAVEQLQQRFKPDFILVAGDDWTDEDMFKALPQESWSIKVGMQRSAARYNLKSYESMIELLQRISKRMMNEKDY
ncbi:bifunctional alpha,alpha-trehalose-phosphate synthase (UDP-forming)/trehalose-phosphatase [candidate division KSB1 bacterium]|nr:bifunctional alpha,alpha-trehalose-phosphate synthase (UDP-forming)/trehalose-phosphatase [candidate division KSB1 bacterium]